MQQNPTPKNRIYELFPEQALVSIKAGAAAVCWAEKTARNMLSDGTFPIKTVRVGSKRLVVVDDLARYYAELVGLDSDTTAPAEPVTSDAAPRPRGRPRKYPAAGTAAPAAKEGGGSMNALTLRTLATFPAELQTWIRAHAARFGDIDELVQQVAVVLLEASRDDTIRTIFNRARSACRRFTQDLAHYGRGLDGVADTHTHAPDGGKKKREIARSISADYGVTTRRARQIIAAQVKRAQQGDLFGGGGRV